MPRLRLGDPANRISLGSFLSVSAVGLMDGVASQGFAGYRAIEQQHARSLKQDGVSCTADYIVIERAGVAHRLILFLRSDVGGQSDTRGCREVRAQFFGCEDPLDLRCEQRQLRRSRGI